MYGLGKLRLGQPDLANVWIMRGLQDTSQDPGGLPVRMPAAIAQLRLDQGRLEEASRAVLELPENTSTRQATATWLRARLCHEPGDAAGAAAMLEDALRAMAGDALAPPSFLALPFVAAAEWRLAADRAHAALANGYGPASAYAREASALRNSLPR